MDSLHSAKEPVRLAVRPSFLDPYDASAALVRAELAAHLRRPEASVKYDGHDMGFFDASRGDGEGEEDDEEEDDLYQDTGVQGLPVTLPGAFQQERRISINEEALQMDLAHLPRELLAGRNISSRRSSHSERRSSVMSIMTCNGWDSAELGAWARSPSRGNRSHRPSLAQSMFAEDLVEEDYASEADKVGKNPSVASWVTYQGETSQDLHSLRLMMMASALEDARNGMPYTAARGSDAGARVPPAGPAPAVVPRMGGQLASSAGQHASVAATPPATSSWSHAYPGAAAAGPPPYYPSVHGVGSAAAPASPYCASAGWQSGYYGGGPCWPPTTTQLPMHAYGHGHSVKQHAWQAGGCAADGAWGQPGDASRTGYPLLPHSHGAPGYHEAAMARTTVMLRNMPEGFTRDNLTGMLDGAGFAGRYDFVYMPMNFRTKASFGYAFVNMVSPDDAQRCHDTFQGFTGWGVLTDKVCEVSWSDMHQGLAAHIDRYRNSPVMHESVPDEYKPVMFHGGKRVAFPPPTKKLRQPRIRRSAEDGDEDELEDGLPAAPALSETGLVGSKAAAWLSPLPPPHLPRGPR